MWTKQTLESGARCCGATAEHQLPNGSFVSAAAGDTNAARPAKELARVLIAQHRA